MSPTRDPANRFKPSPEFFEFWAHASTALGSDAEHSQEAADLMAILFTDEKCQHGNQFSEDDMIAGCVLFLAARFCLGDNGYAKRHRFSDVLHDTMTAIRAEVHKQSERPKGPKGLVT